MKKKTLVLGASSNPARYSNKAIHKLLYYNHPVVAIGARPDKVEDVVNVGDEILVKVTEIDRQGRVNLSRKEVLQAKA